MISTSFSILQGTDPRRNSVKWQERLISFSYYDLKLIDSKAHRHFTGVENALILSNLRMLSSLGALMVIRVPLVPGVTDTAENLQAIAERSESAGLVRVDLLPYNRAAGGKYRNLGT